MTNRTDVEPAQSPLARILAAGPAARALTSPCLQHPRTTPQKDPSR